MAHVLLYSMYTCCYNVYMFVNGMSCYRRQIKCVWIESGREVRHSSTSVILPPWLPTNHFTLLQHG